ncbi:MAG: hypothetical protein M1812_007173 [Candelaria pacifica]|nr:MAG: hypothetical protein M1812_007173 [Candelaria pacifica]
MAPSNSDLLSDVEQKVGLQSYLKNTAIRNFAWQNITVTVKDSQSKQQKAILDGIQGYVEPGKMCALMGPSGCGKTTLLNALAQRDAAPSAKVQGSVLVNGATPARGDFRRISSYVEQEDALIGSLTVKETMDFAARLSLPSGVSKMERLSRIEVLIESFGLRDQAQLLVGTPIRKGVSGGQKRRLSVASQLVTCPRILFLDEPTSGLDSSASFEVMSYVKEVARQNNLIIIASIHQPSSSTFKLFDDLLLLSEGKVYYNGPVTGIKAHFYSLGYPMPDQINPAEFVLDLMNIDFVSEQQHARARLETMHNMWINSSAAASINTRIAQLTAENSQVELDSTEPSNINRFLIPWTLVHRSFIKSYRDVIAYGVRVAMYTGLAIMMGTVWLRLPTTQESIQPFINAIFFGSAFMSFMAVAYVPAFLEDRATFVKERANGLYGPTAFVIANFIIGIPYLFLISVLFSLIAYWLTNFRPTATAFFTWVMWLFLDLLAAESLVVLISSIFPTFVIALALTAFANGLWMSVGGFLVPPKILNVFWRYGFHYIDYQVFSFFTFTR